MDLTPNGLTAIGALFGAICGGIAVLAGAFKMRRDGGDPEEAEELRDEIKELRDEIKELRDEIKEQGESLDGLHRKVDGQGRALARLEGILSVRRR